MGYFFGFKLHIVINCKGELLNFMINPDNTDDRVPLKKSHLYKHSKENSMLTNDASQRIDTHPFYGRTP